MLRIVILVAALAAGGIAAWTALAFRGQPPVVAIVEPPPPPPVQDVLVASSDLGLGQTLTKDNMRWQSWPDSALNPAYISRAARPDALETLAGRIVRNRMPANEPIRNENLVPLNASFLSTRLPPGKRAVAVTISAQNTAGGFILPNDRVDVIVTVAADEKSDPVSRTILRNVLVLAIDQTVDEQSKEEPGKDEKGPAKASAVVGKTATLELSSSQAEILTSGERTGTLSLALRSAADNGEAVSQSSLTVKSHRIGGIEVVDLLGSESESSVESAATTKGSGPVQVTRQAAQ
jgi:pilus assembly protein CpaB